MTVKLPRWLFLAIILVATVGAGLTDILTEVVPLRPYTQPFTQFPTDALGRSSIMYDIILVTLLVVLVASLIRAVANQTTGIVISHSGFTPDPNITATPGAVPIIELFPLVFAFIGLAVWLRGRSMNGGV